MNKEKAIRKLQKQKAKYLEKLVDYSGVTEVFDMAIKALEQSKRKKGKWVIEPDRTVMHCNVCGWAFEYYAGLEEEWNYCPHCGSDNRGKLEDQ